jgi:hypothetical protein
VRWLAPASGACGRAPAARRFARAEFGVDQRSPGCTPSVEAAVSTDQRATPVLPATTTRPSEGILEAACRCHARRSSARRRAQAEQRQSREEEENSVLPLHFVDANGEIIRGWTLPYKYNLNCHLQRLGIAPDVSDLENNRYESLTIIRTQPSAIDGYSSSHVMP